MDACDGMAILAGWRLLRFLPWSSESDSKERHWAACKLHSPDDCVCSSGFVFQQYY